MPRTLRLSEDTAKALTETASAEGISEQAIIEKAVVEYIQKPIAVRDALIDEIFTDYEPLLDRLA